MRTRRLGTTAMVAGTLTSAVGTFLYQVIGSRALGADSFAAVSVMWTLLFLGITVFLIPIEQLLIRRLTVGGGESSAVRSSWPVVLTVLAAAALLAVGFTLVARESLLEGDHAYILLAALMFPANAILIIGRGFLAGRGRFVAYGTAVGLDAIGKVAGAVVVAVLGLGAVALSWVLVLSPLAALLVRPFRAVSGEPVDTSDSFLGSDRRFMAGLVVATAASQTVLAAGPLVVGALGASSAAISVFFVTTTLFRGPMSASYNLIARVLPGLTRDAAAGNHAGVNRLVLRFTIVGTGLAIAVGLVSSIVGPRLVELLYGADFRPSSSLVGMAAAAVIVGIVGLGTTQVLVGRGHTDRLAVVWLVAVAVAGAAIVLIDADPTIRVVAAFLGGEAVAMFGLTVSALLPDTRAPVQPG